MTASDPHYLVDLALARRLEGAEGRASADFVEARERRAPERGAQWRESGGVLAMFDGVDSPVTQTFGLGLSAPVTDALMEELEAFFRERGAPVLHEVSPIADDSALRRLNARGYRPTEFTSVLFREIQRSPAPAGPVAPGLIVRVARADDAERWVDATVEGWSEFPEYAEQMRELAWVSVESRAGSVFLVELGGEVVATGALALAGGVALFAGASTIPRARRMGAQRALLDARLRHAVEAGCDLAMICAQPGSASQRNAEREGFRIAYTRIKWVLGGGD